MIAPFSQYVRPVQELACGVASALDKCAWGTGTQRTMSIGCSDWYARSIVPLPSNARST